VQLAGTRYTQTRLQPCKLTNAIVLKEYAYELILVQMHLGKMQ